MTYLESLDFILKKQSLGIKPGLSRIKSALSRIGNPQDTYKTIHIAGTNGKGTVAATVAKALENEGFMVGLFTSPWVTGYREQIQINGNMISETSFSHYAEMLDGMNTDCTEFECACIIAFTYFSDMNVDWAVIECGMGGKGDATNVEKENISVITEISLDHTDFLGNTVEEIAKEKSGILRENCTCILYNDKLKKIFENKCKKLVTGGLKDNLSLVNAVLAELNAKPVNELVSLPARCERIGKVLLDGGHNTMAAERLALLIENRTAVIGMMKDKNVDGYLSLVAPKCKKIIAVTVDITRSMPAKELADIAKKYCENVEIIESPETAVKEKDVDLVCGSFYLAMQVRKILLGL